MNKKIYFFVSLAVLELCADQASLKLSTFKVN